MVNTIEKKCQPELFEQLRSGSRNCDLRVNDFRVATGDIIKFREYDPVKKMYTGKEITRVVKKVNKIDLLKLYKQTDLGKGVLLIELS